MKKTQPADGKNTTAKIMDLSHFPPVQHGETTTGYIQQILDSTTDPAQEHVLLPSLMTFARLLNIPPREVQAAFLELRNQGYHTLAGGYYGHVSVWKPKPYGSKPA